MTMTNQPPQPIQDTPERILARKRLASLMQEVHALYEYLGEKPKVVGLCGGCQKMRLVDKRAA